MQLILDANSAIDINGKMATFQHEAIDKKNTNGVDAVVPGDDREIKTSHITEDDINKPDIIPKNGNLEAMQTNDKTHNVGQDIVENGIETDLVKPQDKQAISEDNFKSKDANENKTNPSTETKKIQDDTKCKTYDSEQNNETVNGNHKELEQKTSEGSVNVNSNLLDDPLVNEETSENKTHSKSEILTESDHKDVTVNLNNEHNTSSVKENQTEIINSKGESEVRGDSDVMNNSGERLETCDKNDQTDINVTLKEDGISDVSKNTDSEIISNNTCKIDTGSEKKCVEAANSENENVSEEHLENITAEINCNRDEEMNTTENVEEKSVVIEQSGSVDALDSAAKNECASDKVIQSTESCDSTTDKNLKSINIIEKSVNSEDSMEIEQLDDTDKVGQKTPSSPVATIIVEDNKKAQDVIVAKTIHENTCSVSDDLSKEPEIPDSSSCKSNSIGEGNTKINDTVFGTNIESITTTTAYEDELMQTKELIESTPVVSDDFCKSKSAEDMKNCKIADTVVTTNIDSTTTTTTAIPNAVIIVDNKTESEKVVGVKRDEDETKTDLSSLKDDKIPESSQCKSIGDSTKILNDVGQTNVKSKKPTQADNVISVTDDIMDVDKVTDTDSTDVTTNIDSTTTAIPNAVIVVDNKTKSEEVVGVKRDEDETKTDLSSPKDDKIPESSQCKSIGDSTKILNDVGQTNVESKKPTQADNVISVTDDIMDVDKVTDTDSTDVTTNIDSTTTAIPNAVIVVDNKTKSEEVVGVKRDEDETKTDLSSPKEDKIPESYQCMSIGDSTKILNDVVQTNVESKKPTQAANVISATDDIMDVDEVTDTTDKKEETKSVPEPHKESVKKSKFTLDILSDDDDEEVQEAKKKQLITPKEVQPIIQKQEQPILKTTEKQCINLDDDDDIMLISDTSEQTNAKAKNINIDKTSEAATSTEKPKPKEEPTKEKTKVADEKEPSGKILCSLLQTPKADDNLKEKKGEVVENKKLVPENFLKTCKKNLIDMTRDDLEELCVLKIVEGIVDRNVLSEIKTRIKAMAKTIEDYKTKTTALTKQNRDLQIVLKSVQEEQKKGLSTPIIPLKITRSVGLQVVMTDKANRKRPAAPQPIASNSGTSSPANPNNRPNRSPMPQAARPQKPNNQQLPVPRLVPANNVANKTNFSAGVSKATVPVTSNANSAKNSPQKMAEKRPRSVNQAMTVDLTDDEPPAKVATRSSPVAPVRLVPAQNLLTPQRQAAQAQNNNNPRKVYIPISGQQNTLRPGQSLVMKPVPSPTPLRQRAPAQQMIRLPQNQSTVRVRAARHPAPLPDAVKQYQPPNWKSLPPAPDLKLSKVENGIVISWKIEGYHEDSYEEIASYQLFAYQETSAQPSTSLWKKIGDVKALALPMACTLTQFMAGYKYYFAVRAVDIRSRFGPFSLPGSILLLNKA